MAGLMEIDEQVLAAKFEALLPHLDERGRRLVLGAEARWLGARRARAGDSALGIARKTVASGARRLNGVIERFFGTLKYEHLYRAPIDDGGALAMETARFRDIYNRIRPHQALDDRTPRQAYLDT